MIWRTDTVWGSGQLREQDADTVEAEAGEILTGLRGRDTGDVK
ncbi:hypothetical protein [Nocardia jinanensis]|nr:hypothetical protein [Nocardia jinanensis]